MRRMTKLTDIPTWLKHKPIYAIKRYEKVDGFYKNDTDVIGLSLGKAQWSKETFVPSVKVWRDVQNDDTKEYRISRQSEETTLTRAVDLALLVVRIYDSLANDKSVDDTIIETIFGDLKIETIGDERLIDELKKYFTKDNLTDLKTHIAILKDAISNLKL